MRAHVESLLTGCTKPQVRVTVKTQACRGAMPGRECVSHSSARSFCNAQLKRTSHALDVAVLQGVLYEAVLTSPMVESVATDDDGQIAGGPLPGTSAKTFIQQQPKAPWNIARLSSNASIAKPSTYYFNSTAGRGVE